MSETIELADDVDFQDVDELELFDPETAARELIGFAVDAHASDIFVTDEPTHVSIRIRRLGRVEPVQKLSREAGRRLQNHFRAISGADVTDQLKPVEGRERVTISDGRAVDMRISALPTVFGQDVALRIFSAGEALMSIEDLGVLSHELAMIRELLYSSSGLLLVSGPTGSGKTSSMYAFLQHLNEREKKIHTLEEPVEHFIPGIVQSQVNVRAGVGYGQLLHAILRHAPDVIMVGEIRDQRTAEIAVRAGGSGQFVIATVHARTAAGAIATMLTHGVNGHFLASSLIGVISQRLVRRLCPHCRQQVPLHEFPDLLQEARGAIASECEPALFLPQSCELCWDGFDQLTCIPEVMKINQATRESIADGWNAERMHQLASQSGMLSFPRAAQLRLALGITTIDEITRVLSDQDMRTH